jgi:hypothetical protein
MGLFTFAVDDPHIRAPADFLAPAWQGLQLRVVKENASHEGITLIAD